MKKLPGDKLDIATQRWLAWHEAARQLGEAGEILGMELQNAERRSTRDNLVYCALLARFAERHTTGDKQLIANACATEIENATS